MILRSWNTDVSAAFCIMPQFCELSIRNGTVEAIQAVFGGNWHLNRGFTYTLPAPKKGYRPREHLTDCAAKFPTASDLGSSSHPSAPWIRQGVFAFSGSHEIVQ